MSSVGKINEIRDYFTDNYSYTNIKHNNTLLNNVSSKLTDIISEIKLKSETNKNNETTRKESALAELDTVLEMNPIEEDVENDFVKAITDLGLLADACNNIAHDCKEYDVRNSIFRLKNIIISSMKREIDKNRKDIDIVDGFKTDGRLEDKRGTYVVDIPGIGELSWHLEGYVPEAVRNDFNKEYPYEIEKGDFRNHDLLLMRIRSNQLEKIPHNYLVANSQIGDENEIREVLETYYSATRVVDENKNEIICEKIGKKTNLSKANIDNLTKVLRVSKEKVYNYRERYIQEENIEREKYGNK